MYSSQRPGLLEALRKDVAKYRDAPVDAGGADVERGECRDEVLLVAHK